MYCTSNDIISAFPDEILADLMENGIINTTTIENVIGQADGIIDGFLRDRYTLPLPEPCDRIIKKISMDLAIVILYENARISSFIPDTIAKKEDRAMTFLYKISEGEISLSNRNQRIYTKISEIEYSHIL